MTGFEYGSGKSTLFFAPRLKHLVSVEHHEEWHTFVENNLKNKNITNVDYNLIKPDVPPVQPEPLPGFYKEFKLKNTDFAFSQRFRSYFEFIKNILTPLSILF